MTMTQQDYEKLIAHFEFLEDKVESCYKRETEKLLEKLKEEYKKCISK